MSRELIDSLPRSILRLALLSDALDPLNLSMMLGNICTVEQMENQIANLVSRKTLQVDYNGRLHAQAGALKHIPVHAISQEDAINSISFGKYS